MHPWCSARRRTWECDTEDRPRREPRRRRRTAFLTDGEQVWSKAGDLIEPSTLSDKKVAVMGILPLPRVLAPMAGAGTSRRSGDCQAHQGALADALAQKQPTAPLDQEEVRLLVDFFLLLKKWDTVDTNRREEPSSTKRVAP